jgi:AGCS family alanine or glycine:cation symporter
VDKLNEILVAFGDFAWGMPLLILLLGGGMFFLIYSRLIPFRYFGHAVQILRGKYDDPDDPGDIDHYEALSTALAATVGVGNISGVAVAITLGGPGAIFWMWMSAMVGVATKFFTCTLAIMYRGKDSEGELQGGPMYVIMEGLGKKWKPLAVFFSLAGLIGCFPMFQANQLTQTIHDVVLEPNGLTQTPMFDFLSAWGLSAVDQTNLMTGLIITFLVSLVIFGGIKRIGSVAGKMVPTMVAIYVIAVLYIIFSNISAVPASLWLIIEDAFTGNAVLGGAVGALIIAGIRRAAFSNEAGIGTAPMAHGAAKTKEPVREGLIAMLGPFIDTIVVCTMTALAIIITGAWTDKEAEGITVTLNAFQEAIPGLGTWILTICVFIFALTTLFSYSYYGAKCLGFLIGAKYQNYYNVIYVGSIILGSMVSVTAAISLIDGMYAMMAIPTVVSTIILAPKVMEGAKEYFGKMNI